MTVPAPTKKVVATKKKKKVTTLKSKTQESLDNMVIEGGSMEDCLGLLHT